MPDIPTTKEIVRHVGAKNYDKGQKYYKSRSIKNGRFSQNSISAISEGNYMDNYFLNVEINDNRGISGYCSCPVGDGGRCKHIAALLLTWKNKSGDFKDTSSYKDTLHKLSKEDLIEVIKKIMQVDQELESMVEVILSNYSSSKSFDFTGEINTIISQNIDGHDGTRRILSRLGLLRDNIDAYIEKKNYLAIVRVVKAIAEQLLQNYEYLDDYEGDVLLFVDETIEYLQPCLDNVDDTNIRQEILETLLFIIDWDIEFGGIDVDQSAQEIIDTSTNKDDRQYLSGNIRKKLEIAFARENGNSWKYERWNSLFVRIQKEIIDSELFLELARNSGNHDLYIDKLLELGHIDESKEYIKMLKGYKFITGLNLLVSHQFQKDAKELAISHFQTNQSDIQLLQWLKESYDKGESEVDEITLDVAFALVNNSPILHNLKFIEKTARVLKKWDDIKDDVILLFEKQGNYDDLARYYNEIGNMKIALESIVKTWEDPHFTSNELTLYIARQSIKKYPEKVLGLCRLVSEYLINQKQRVHYKRACQYLTVMKSAFEKLGKMKEWEIYIADLQKEKKGFRALLGELGKAKLI